MQLMGILILQAAFIIPILFQLASGNDIILYDEFHFTFDLLNEKDWDQYHISNHNNQQNTLDFHGRRLMDGFDDQYDDNYDEYNQYDDDYDVYHPFNQYHQFHSDDEYASTCTERIPVIFKHLCVHWDMTNGFIFNYKSKLAQSKRNNYQTNWFYSSRDSKISSAKNAGKYY
eukprot:41372_1